MKSSEDTIRDNGEMVEEGLINKKGQLEVHNRETSSILTCGILLFGTTQIIIITLLIVMATKL